jgi:hypothetical protein
VRSVYTVYLPLVYHARTAHPHVYTHRDTQRHTEIHRHAHTLTHTHTERERHKHPYCVFGALALALNIHTPTLPPRLHRGTHRSIQRFTEAHAFQLGVSIHHIPTNLLLFCFTYTIQIVNYMCIWYIHSYILFSSIDFYIPIV